MREIKYRGKRRDNGEWVYGSLIVTNAPGYEQYYISLFVDTCEEDMIDGLPHCIEARGYEVISESVGELTGLKDKAGKDIYESDIVKNSVTTKVWGKDEGERYGSFRDVTTESLCRVEWDNYWGQWKVCNGNVRSILEVIGNIYEHPELLKP